MSAILPLYLLDIDETEVGLVDERGGLEVMSEAFIWRGNAGQSCATPDRPERGSVQRRPGHRHSKPAGARNIVGTGGTQSGPPFPKNSTQILPLAYAETSGRRARQRCAT